MSSESSTGLPAFEPGALPHPIGLAAVPVGPRMFAVLCGVIALSVSRSLPSLGVQLALLLAASAALGLLGPLLHRWRPFIVLAASILIIYAWAYPGSATQVWIFGVEGFWRGLSIVVRLLGFVTVLQLLLLATGPLAIVRWVGDVNEDLGIMVSLTLGVIPAMSQQMHVTLEAQQARGLSPGRTLIGKLRMYLAVLVPVVVKSLVRAYGMAALLHVRGYGSGGRTAADRARTGGAAACYALGAVWLLAAAAGSLLT